MSARFGMAEAVPFRFSFGMAEAVPSVLVLAWLKPCFLG
jgi:hypothetical protein